MGERLVRRPETEGQPPTGLEPRPEPRLTFAALYESSFAFVWRTAKRLGTPEADLDDMVQEIFIVAYRRQDQFEGRSSVKTWLYGIVFNVVRAHRRQLRAKYPHTLDSAWPEDPDLLADGADGLDELLARREAARFLDRFLDSLVDERRDVFVLAELEELSAPEIATVLGVPVNTVYSRLRLARLDLSKAVARHLARETRRNHDT